MWHRGQSEPAATLEGHTLTVSAVAASADGTRALSGSRDSTLRLWDLATAECLAQNHVSRNVVTCAKWVPGEESLVAQGSEDLRRHHADEDVLIREHRNHMGGDGGVLGLPEREDRIETKTRVRALEIPEVLGP